MWPKRPSVKSSPVVMGLDQNFLIRVRSAIFDFGFGLGKFPLKIPDFSIFSNRIKKNLIRSGQKVPGSKWISLLFTAGQRYARVGSGQGPSLVTSELALAD